MLYFEILFPLFMLMTPLMVALFYSPADGANRSDVRIPMGRLLTWTLITVAVFVAFLMMRLLGQFQLIENPPWIFGFGKPIDQVMWVLFFPLWFVCAMPVIRASRPEIMEPTSQTSSVRAASLQSRRNMASIPTWMAWIPVALWFIAIGYCLNNGLLSEGVPQKFKALTILCLGLGTMGLFAGPAIRLALQEESEPMDPNHSPQLANAYQRYRNAKAVGLFTLFVVMQVFELGTACLLVTGAFESPDLGRIMGLVGGIGGSLVGIAGGGFGAYMGHKRMKINELRDQLSGQAS